MRPRHSRFNGFEVKPRWQRGRGIRPPISVSSLAVCGQVRDRLVCVRLRLTLDSFVTETRRNFHEPASPHRTDRTNHYIWLSLSMLDNRFKASRRPGIRPPLPGTKPLTMTGDIASELVAGVDRFLLKQIDESRGQARAYWKRDFSSLQGLRRFGRTQSQAAGAHPGRARSRGTVRHGRAS